MREDLDFARAVLVDAFERWDIYFEALITWHASFLTGAAAAKPRKTLDISMIIGHIDVVTKIVERIEKVRAQNAISKADFARLSAQMFLSVDKRVRDAVPDEASAQAILRAIRTDWLTLAAAAA